AYSSFSALHRRTKAAGAVSTGRSDPVAQRRGAAVLRAACTAEHAAILLHAMADDAAGAMLAAWCHRLDRAFEAVEGHGSPGHHNVERLVVVVPALSAACHGGLPPGW